jgi:hypothetical protein
MGIYDPRRRISMHLARVSLFLGILWMLAPDQARAQLPASRFLPSECFFPDASCDPNFRNLIATNLPQLQAALASRGFRVIQYSLQQVSNCFVAGTVFAQGPRPNNAAVVIRGIIAGSGRAATYVATSIQPAGSFPEGIGQSDHCIPSDNFSPILLDFGKSGFDLTSVRDGVRFDIDADGTPDQVAWTAARPGDAFLALDRNGNGQIDSGAELFGDATPLADGTRAPDGYAALAELDLPAQGGNSNGYIDSGDGGYRDLLLWTDYNHDGVSQRAELVTLARRGVLTLLTDASSSTETDKHGNVFALVSQAYVRAGQRVRPIPTVDVFLVTQRGLR